MPTMTARRSLVSFAAALLLVGGPRPVAAQYPVFDAHIHYSRPDWDAYPPERALALLARAGVRRALVSSTSDDGTLELYERAPTVVVPFLRPYRTREDMGGWHADAGVAEYVEERLKRGVYRGIGEFHLGAAGVDAPVVRRIAELAAERDLFLHAHVDAETIEKLLGRYPKVRFSGPTRACRPTRRPSAACSTASRSSGWSWRYVATSRQAAGSIPSGARASCATRIASWSGPTRG